MRFLVGFFLIAFSFSASAENFSCGLYYNLDRISDSNINTKLNEKVLIIKTDIATAYLNQKSHRDFELELYLPEQQMRLYSRADLSEGDAQISISTWSRDSLIDVLCKRHP